MLYEAEEVLRLIPQREPVVMVSSLIDAGDNVCHTTLNVTADNYFVEDDGLMAETGLIEHIAQSASAFAGHKYLQQSLPAPIGYIGEVRKFHCYRRPAVGDELRTEIVFEAEAAGVTLMSGTTVCNGETVAETKMKIFVESAS